MIAGEAIEIWKLPGFEIPKDKPDFLDRVRRLWQPGLMEFDVSAAKNAADYPFNGLLGGISAAPVLQDESNVNHSIVI